MNPTWRRLKNGLNQPLQSEANKVMMEIEQEKPQPLDATARVPVPSMDFSVPNPEWHEYRTNPWRMFAWICSHDWHGFDPGTWPVDRITESKMVWLPWLRRNPKPMWEETVSDGDQATSTFLACPQDTDVVNSSILVWKQAGISILQDEEDEDEDGDVDDDRYGQNMNGEENDKVQLIRISEKLKPAVAKKEDLMAVVKKRKRILDNRNREDRNSTWPPEKRPSRGNNGAGSNLLVADEQGISSKLLENYMGIHAPKKLKPTLSSFFKVSKKETTPPIEPQKDAPSQIVATIQALPEVPKPKICLPKVPFHIVISVTTPRGVIRHLESLLPSVKLIDRDYGAYNDSGWLPGSICRSEVMRPR